MKINEMKIDAVKFEQGDWVTEIPEMGELKLKVRGIGNTDYRKMQTKLHEAEPRQYKVGGKLPQERQDAILSKCLLHTILLDWDGLQDGDGNPLPYSKDLARELLTETAFKRFRDAVSWAASFVAENIASDEEHDGKNSETPSVGT